MKYSKTRLNEFLAAIIAMAFIAYSHTYEKETQEQIIADYYWGDE